MSENRSSTTPRLVSIGASSSVTSGSYASTTGNTLKKGSSSYNILERIEKKLDKMDVVVEKVSKLEAEMVEMKEAVFLIHEVVKTKDIVAQAKEHIEDLQLELMELKLEDEKRRIQLQVESLLFPRKLSTMEALSFVDKRKFFEKEIKDQGHLGPKEKKEEKKFSYLSADEVAKLKQEDEKKMVSMSQEELMRYMADETDKTNKEGQDMNRILTSLENSDSTETSPAGSAVVRTAKSERRSQERLKQGGTTSPPSDGERSLTPQEERSIQAEKRAAWRKARMKSLEEDAIKAQAVLAKVREIKGDDTVQADDVSVLSTVNIEIEEKNKTNESNSSTKVETTKQQIVQLEVEKSEGQEPLAPNGGV